MLKPDFYGADINPCEMCDHTPAPYFRHEFCMNDIKSAKVLISGLGFYRIFLNGKDITKGFLAPYISNLNHYIYYDEYDIKDILLEGKNVLGVLLGNGMRNPVGARVWSFHTADFKGVPCFALEFCGNDSEGDVEFSAKDFKYAPSPIQFDDLRAGEWYDANFETDNWAEACFDDSDWQSVVPVAAPKGIMRKATIDPIITTKELKALSIRRSKISIRPVVRDCYNFVPFNEKDEVSGGWLYDFGVNAAGICRLKIKNSKPGQKIILQFGEILGEPDSEDENYIHRDENRGLDLSNWSFLPHNYNSRDVYICKGNEIEEWAPSFTYHGFRYCLVMGIEENQVTEDLLTYQVMNTDLKALADFRCSDTIANRLWDATKVSNLANFYHVPTDCPHREKNAWTGDAALSAEQMIMSLSVDKNFEEWLYNIRAAFNPDNSLPSIIPSVNWGVCGPAWDSVLYYLPYYLWQYRNNTKVISDNSDAFMKYLNFIEKSAKNTGIIEIGLGDWCQVGRSPDNPETPNSFTSTMISIDICKKAEEMFKFIGQTERELYAHNLGEKLKTTARSRFIESSKVTCSTQTAIAMAIYYGLLTSEEEKSEFERLVKIITDNNYSHNCGILGLRVIFHVLSKYDRTDLAFKMITKKDFPSYGYWIENGATSLWELFTPYNKRQSSCNHHFMGDIISWFMQNLVGINQDFRYENKITLSPKFIEDLDFANGYVTTPIGKVSASWHRIENKIIYKTNIPHNVKLELMLENGYCVEKGNLTSGESEIIIRRKFYGNLQK